MIRKTLFMSIAIFLPATAFSNSGQLACPPIDPWATLPGDFEPEKPDLGPLKIIRTVLLPDAIPPNYQNIANFEGVGSAGFRRTSEVYVSSEMGGGMPGVADQLWVVDVVNGPKMDPEFSVTFDDGMNTLPLQMDGLAFFAADEPVDDVLYAWTQDDSLATAPPGLYEIDLMNGAATLVPTAIDPTTVDIAGIAADRLGNVYGIDNMNQEIVSIVDADGEPDLVIPHPKDFFNEMEDIDLFGLGISGAGNLAEFFMFSHLHVDWRLR